MYVPDRFRETDRRAIRAFMRGHSFATLVTVDGNRPVATHVPVVVRDGPGDGMVLEGHVSRQNPQGSTFGTGREALVIFPGPHAYVSAGWYRGPAVPTWNYMSVHAYGTASVVEESGLLGILQRLVEANERGGSTGYSLEGLPEGYVEGLMKGIVGFTIDVVRLEASFKLSQNTAPESYERVIVELGRRGDEGSRRIAEEMARRRP